MLLSSEVFLALPCEAEIANSKDLHTMEIRLIRNRYKNRIWL
jgi:hypothetical protein